jgi:putative ABC transport system permease protein
MSRLRSSDLLALSGRSLAQHKGRTALTLLGVILGAFLLVVSLSVGQGIKHAVKRTLSFGGKLKVIDVFPDHSVDPDSIPAEELAVDDTVGRERKARIRESLIQRWQMRHGYQPGKPLSESELLRIEAWDDVERVTPEIVGQARFHLDGRSEYAQITARWGDNPFVEELFLYGAPSADDGRGVLIHEFLAYRFGFRTDEQLRGLIGRPVQLEFGSYLHFGVIGLLQARASTEGDEQVEQAEREQLERALAELSEFVERLPLNEEQKQKLRQTLKPEPRADEEEFHFVEEFTVAGIVRSPSEEELAGNWHEHQLRHSEVILPIRTARTISQQIPHRWQNGYNSAQVIADDETNVAALSQRLRERGLQVRNRLEWIELVQNHVAVITTVMATIAAVALFVAALGISNVMTMSVLERTHEIGIMKAVGAREETIRRIFLFEGSLVGLLGGSLGVGLGSLASIPGNTIARWVLAQRGFEENLDGTLFAFPLWILLGIPAFAALLTMLASYLPARRASRIDPIEALRHD